MKPLYTNSKWHLKQKEVTTQKRHQKLDCPIIWLVWVMESHWICPVSWKAMGNCGQSWKVIEFSTRSWKSHGILLCLIFSAHEPKSARRLLFIMSTFPLKPLNRIQRHLTGSTILTSVTKFCFSGRSEKQDGHPASDSLNQFRLAWNRWRDRISTKLDRMQYLKLVYQVCFFGWSEKQDCSHDLWLAQTISTSPLKPLNRIQRNLTCSKISTSSIKFVFFGRIGKTRWQSWRQIGRAIVDFSSGTAEQLYMGNLKLYCQICVLLKSPDNDSHTFIKIEIANSHNIRMKTVCFYGIYFDYESSSSLKSLNKN